MRLNRGGCFGVGIHCGGWGHIGLEVENRRSEIKQQHFAIGYH
jgi:hypothetical protein